MLAAHGAPSPPPLPSDRIALVDRFVLARKLAKTDTTQMLEVCMQLLDQRDAETAIRVGDVFALLIYFHMQAKNYEQAHGLIESMRGRGIPVDPFVDSATVQAIFAAVGRVYTPAASPSQPGVGEIAEDIVET